MSTPEAKVPGPVQRAYDEANRKTEQARQAATAPPAAPATPDRDPKAQDAHPPQPPDRGSVWEERYNALQGKYQSEVPRLREEMRQAQQHAADLELKFREQTERIRQLEQKAVAVEMDEQAKAIEAQINEIETDEGDEAVAKVFRGQQETIRAQKTQIDRLQARLDQLEGAVTQTSQSAEERARERFWGDIKQALPERAKTEADPDFGPWCEEIDPASRRFGAPKTRQEVINEAAARLDSQTIIDVYEEFGRRDKSAVVPPQSLSPSGGSRSSEGIPSQGRTYTESEVATFWKEMRLGRYDSKEEEAERLQRDIHAARFEGRIVPG